MLISPSRDVDVSLFRDSYYMYKSVRLGGFKSVENDYYFNGGVTPQIFLKLSE